MKWVRYRPPLPLARPLLRLEMVLATGGAAADRGGLLLSCVRRACGWARAWLWAVWVRGWLFTLFWCIGVQYASWAC